MKPKLLLACLVLAACLGSRASGQSPEHQPQARLAALLARAAMPLGWIINFRNTAIPNHGQAHLALHNWQAQTGIDLMLNPEFELDYPEANLNVFYAARLTNDQAAQLRADFPELIVTRDKLVAPCAAVADTTTNWGVNNIFNRQTPVLPGSIAVPPIFYVVGTGIERKVTATSTHPEFLPSNGVVFLQGIVSRGLTGTWPPPPGTTTTPTGWDLPVGAILPDALGQFSAPTTLCPIDPYQDPTHHETSTCSTAIGDTFGILAHLNGSPRVEVMSVKIYPRASTTTTVAHALSGIGQAVRHYLALLSSLPNPETHPGAVMLFASRTIGSAAFDENLEYALLDTWAAGITVICAAGNKGSASQDPTAFAYPFATALPAWCSSPSRFAAPTVGLPSHPYLVIVGGSNASMGSSLINGWASISSRGPEIDLIAPCNNLPLASNTGTTRRASGTSYSSGYVAGFALYALAIDPSLTPDDVYDWLLNIGTPGSPTVTSSALKSPRTSGLFLPQLRW